LIFTFIKGVKISEPLHTEIYLIPSLLGKSVGIESFFVLVDAVFYEKKSSVGESAQPIYQSQFHFHVSARDLYIPTILLQENKWTGPGNCSQTHQWENWD
jgi:hypothetical protein